ncbi:hypothetical protein E3N88_12937 [Mikania micrantha]|uniref:Uncharacterized protein n=1 Tax=Mikania micrantha TaxID=192012 RepID=A0A5N6P872_9ASTR|nr:hypothetical protein E3N88_12937 [Mikania micrantha]
MDGPRRWRTVNGVGATAGRNWRRWANLQSSGEERLGRSNLQSSQGLQIFNRSTCKFLMSNLQSSVGNTESSDSSSSVPQSVCGFVQLLFQCFQIAAFHRFVALCRYAIDLTSKT